MRGYELKEEIGSGPVGAVYRAYQPSVGRDVAIKVILPRSAASVEFIRRFEAEAQTIMRLEHPHIAPLYDYWRESDKAFLVMRLFRGGNLESIMKTGPGSTDRASKMVDQIASALSVIHSHTRISNRAISSWMRMEIFTFAISAVRRERLKSLAIWITSLRSRSATTP
jgi:serine/threonine protein kinase